MSRIDRNTGLNRGQVASCWVLCRSSRCVFVPPRKGSIIGQHLCSPKPAMQTGLLPQRSNGTLSDSLCVTGSCRWNQLKSDRRLLSVGLGPGNSPGGSQYQTLADLPAAAQQVISSVIAQDQSAYSQKAKLTASDGVANDHFGCSVAISGNTVVVGAGATVGANATRGRPTCSRSPAPVGHMTQTAKLTASDGPASDDFGSRLRSAAIRWWSERGSQVGGNTTRGRPTCSRSPAPVGQT